MATTRLVLTRAGSDGLEAAGHVVASFADFVAGDKIVVGIIIFVIIIVIQFVVITKGGERVFLRGDIPGTEGQPHTTIAGGGHFLQEDIGEELARVIVEFVASA